jgi:hypothetical protein
VGKKMVEGVIEEDVVEDLIKGGYVRDEVEGDVVEKKGMYQELVMAEEVVVVAEEVVDERKEQRM